MKHTNTFLTKSLLVLLLSSGANQALATDDLGHTRAGWITSSEKHGLTLFSNNNQKLAHAAGNFERFDSRSISDDAELIAATNQSSNSVDLFRLKNNSFTKLASVEVNEDALDGVCLFKSKKDQAIYAFLLKSQQPVEQRLVFDLKQQQTTNLFVRNLPINFDLSDCAVDDTQAKLYIAEKTVAIWAYGADPEDSFERKAINVHAPFGQIEDEIEALQILDDGSLIVSQPGTQGFIYQPGTQIATTIKASGGVDYIAGYWSTNKALVLGLSRGEGVSLETTAVKPLTQSPPATFAQVSASQETPPVARFGDAADDPAIWVNPNNPQQSLVLATDKKSGLAVYDLQGKQTQFLAQGRLNNVDVRNDFSINNTTVALAAASHRDNNSIALFAIDYQSRQVNYLSDVSTSLDEVYGLCMFANNHQQYVFINDKDGRYQQYAISSDKGKVSGKLVREFKLIDQPEGCVADDRTQQLFLGVEDHGIWISNAMPETTSQPQQIVKVGGHLKDDVEGMAIYQQAEHSYLVVSSQGNNSYALYDTKAPYTYRGSFQVGLNISTGIDGISETDGLDVVSANLGGQYSKGLFVAQDGRNVMPAQPQNFKYISFEQILDSLKLNSQ